MQHGHGVEQWVDGSVYDGAYEFGKKHGMGKLSFPHGSYYVGQF